MNGLIFAVLMRACRVRFKVKCSFVKKKNDYPELSMNIISIAYYLSICTRVPHRSFLYVLVVGKYWIRNERKK